MKVILKTVALLICVAHIHAADSAFLARLRVPTANAELPKHVTAAENALTLFADHEHPEEFGIPLYLVNRTKDDVPLSLSSIIKLEYQLPTGLWERAEPHQYPDCGTYGGGPYALHPGMHLRFYGHRPEDGTPAQVRYSSYGFPPLISNTGAGLYASAEVQAAKVDLMSIRDVPSSIFSCFNPEYPSPHVSASQRLATLRMAMLLGERPAIRAVARQWSDEMAASSDLTPNQRLVQPAVTDILKQDWGKPAGNRPLLDQCIAIVKSDPNPKTAMGGLEKERALAWNVIQEIAALETGTYKSDPPPSRRTEPAIWQELFNLALNQVQTVPQEEGHAIIKLLHQSPWVDELLTNRALEALLVGVKPYAADFAAYALSKRSQWERLSELGIKLKADRQITILTALARGSEYDPAGGGSANTHLRIDAFYPPNSTKEEAFWDHVLKSLPMESAAALSSCFSPSMGNTNPFTSRRFGALKTYWRQEAARSQKASAEFDLGPQAYNVNQSLAFLAAWNDPHDIPLLRSLLTYRGYSKEIGSRSTPNPGLWISYERHTFQVRSTAAAALKRLGEKVPKDLVCEIEVTPTHTGPSIPGKQTSKRD